MSRCGRGQSNSRTRRSGCLSSAARSRSGSRPGTVCRSRGLRDDIIRYGNFTETELQRQTGYSTAVSTDYVSPENRRAAQFAREDFRGLTMADVER
jgi:hypothetical protein